MKVKTLIKQLSRIHNQNREVIISHQNGKEYKVSHLDFDKWTNLDDCEEDVILHMALTE